MENPIVFDSENTKQQKEIREQDINKNITEWTIPEGVTSIGENVFLGCRALKNITIPDSVTSIGNYALDGCHDDITIYGREGSYSEKYAKQNGIAFEVMSSKITTREKKQMIQYFKDLQAFHRNNPNPQSM